MLFLQTIERVPAHPEGVGTREGKTNGGAETREFHVKWL